MQATITLPENLRSRDAFENAAQRAAGKPEKAPFVPWGTGTMRCVQHGGTTITYWVASVIGNVMLGTVWVWRGRGDEDTFTVSHHPHSYAAVNEIQTWKVPMEGRHQYDVARATMAQIWEAVSG